MVPHEVEADVEVRYRVPHCSRAHFGYAPIGIAVRYGRDSRYAPTTERRLRSTVVLHADHAAIERRSPLRIPPMLLGGVERPYRREFHIGALGASTFACNPN